MCVADEDGARGADEAFHLADELPFRPDVHERVGAHREAEGTARERHRRVAVAADRLAAGGSEAPREPDLRNVQSAWVKEQEVEIADGKISGYKVNMLISFVLE